MSLLDAAAAPNFDDPLGLLGACHTRILGFCDQLDRLLPWIEEHGADAEARSAAQRIARYFEVAGRLHHQDEEDDLFPLLANDREAGPLIQQLLQEHREIDRMWERLSALLRALTEGKIASPALQAAIIPFCTAQRRHVEIENTQILTPAAVLLKSQQLAALGQSMAARRQLNHQRPE